MDGRVDPTTSLRKKNAEGIRNNSLADSLRAEHVLTLGERLQHESSEVSIFTEKEEVFLVKGIDNVLRVVLHNVGIREDRNPITSITLWCLDTIHAEATG